MKNTAGVSLRNAFFVLKCKCMIFVKGKKKTQNLIQNAKHLDKRQQFCCTYTLSLHRNHRSKVKKFWKTRLDVKFQLRRAGFRTQEFINDVKEFCCWNYDIAAENKWLILAGISILTWSRSFNIHIIRTHTHISHGCNIQIHKHTKTKTNRNPLKIVNDELLHTKSINTNDRRHYKFYWKSYYTTKMIMLKLLHVFLFTSAEQQKTAIFIFPLGWLVYSSMVSFLDDSIILMLVQS